MLIKHKLFLNALLMGVALLAMFLLLVNQSSSLTDLGQGLHLSEKLNSNMLKLRRHEKDFLARKDLKYQPRFDEVIQQLNGDMDALRKIMQEYDIDPSNLDTLRGIFSEYHQIFNDMVSSQVTIGLDSKSGLYGELRAAVHDAESLLKENQNYLLLSDMLQLRRAEKDFMLRLDTKYLTRFDELVLTMDGHLNQSNIPASTLSEIQGYMQAYRDKFKALVDAQVAIGVDPNSGMLGRLRSKVHETESQLDLVLEETSAAIASTESSVITWATSLFVVILVVIATVSYLLSRSVLIPINHICQSIDKIRRTNDLRERAKVIGNDEISVMADNFNRMVGSFEALIQDVNNAISVMNTATAELAQNIASTTNDMQRQCQETDMVATAATEMEATVEEIARKTENAANMAQQANHNAQNVQTEVQNTVTNIRGLADQLNESVAVVAELAKDSETIGSVLDVIRGIADQTNLLALNAAIEAARAGEQGRGFAVVAEEVRNLAMRTAESTQEISTIIESLQQRTGNIVQLIERVSGQGFESAEQAETAGGLLMQITDDVNLILDMSTQIATAVEEQSYVAAEVNKNVVNIRDITEHATESAEANAKAGEEVAEQSAILNTAAQRFKV